MGRDLLEAGDGFGDVDVVFAASVWLPMVVVRLDGYGHGRLVDGEVGDAVEGCDDRNSEALLDKVSSTCGQRRWVLMANM